MAHQPVEVHVDYAHKQLTVHVDVPEWRLEFQGSQLGVTLARESVGVLQVPDVATELTTLAEGRLRAQVKSRISVLQRVLEALPRNTDSEDARWGGLKVNINYITRDDGSLMFFCPKWERRLNAS